MAAGGGVDLPDLVDFVRATGPVEIMDSTGYINDASLRTYLFWRLMSGDRAMVKKLQGGEYIQFHTYFDAGDTFEDYLPGQFHDYENPQPLREGRADWRYNRDHMTFIETEVIHNEVIQQGTPDARFQEFVRIRDLKRSRLKTSTSNGLENRLFNVPDKDAMEGTGNRQKVPYSFFTFINEWSNGLFNFGNTGAWTVVHNLDPADATETNGNWTPAQETYSSDANDNVDNIFGGMDDLFQDIQFEQPETHKQYFEDPRLNKQMIITSKRGRSIFQGLLRGKQDRLLAGYQDPSYPDPQYNGIPVKRNVKFEEAAVYDDGSSGLATEFAADNKGPRYMFVNGNYIGPVVHARRFWYERPPSRHHNVQDTEVVEQCMHWNLVCTSRRRQGHLRPEGDVYTS